MLPDPKLFANEWIESWNSHNLDRIMSHYAEDVQVTSPMIKVATGSISGTIHGKASVCSYWKAGLEKVPDLRFKLLDYTIGVDSLAICYLSVWEKMAVEVMFFDEKGKVLRVIAHYN